MKQRYFNATLAIAALALTTLLILTALPLAGTAAPRPERQPLESLTALNGTEAAESGAPSAASVVQSSGTTTRISAAPRLEWQPLESLTALNSTEATERGAPLDASSTASVVQSPSMTTCLLLTSAAGAPEPWPPESSPIVSCSSPGVEQTKAVDTGTLQSVADEWQLLGFSGVGVWSIAFSPDYANDHTIFIGTSSGPFRSTDGGASWVAVNTGSPDLLGSLTFSPNYTNDRTLFAGGSSGVYRSTDGGITWTSVGLGTEVISALAISPNFASDQTLFAGTYAENGRVFLSTDGGSTWVDTGLVLNHLDVRGLAISPNYANDRTIFVGTGRAWDWYGGGVYRSTDGGATWATANNGLTYQEVGALAISPNYNSDQTLFVTVWAGGVYRSTDGGNSWVEANNGQPNRRLSALALSPNYASDRTVFLGTWGEYNDGGVYRSTDGGASWTVMNTGLTTRWIHRVVTSPNYSSDHFLLAGGEQSNGGGLWGKWVGGWPNSIVTEARADIGMPYPDCSRDAEPRPCWRGCLLSDYVGCGGPFHGFYYGVCTDLAMDAYNWGVPFNLQTALSQDHGAHPGRYHWGSARNAEDLRRYFSYKQQLLPHDQAYQPGDIAFFDKDISGVSDHVGVISEVDADGRPLRMVHATDSYSYNPSGLAFEQDWSSYYDQRVQEHGRLGGAGALAASAGETLHVLRITLDSSSVNLSLHDADGKSTSSSYDESLVAINNEAAIPYIPGGTYADLGAEKVITVTQPLSNTTQYFVELTGQAVVTYHLHIETLQDSSVTDSQVFTQPIATGETHNSVITLSAPGGTIEFTATSLDPSPALDIPDSLELIGPVYTPAQAIFAVAEIGGQQPLQNVVVSATDLMDQIGGIISSTLFAITPNSFTVPAGGGQDVIVEVSLAGVMGGVYRGSLVITSDNGSTRMIPVELTATDFQLNAQPVSQTVMQNQTVTYTLALTAYKNFTCSITLAITGLPTDTTSIIAPNPITPTASAALTVTTALTTSTGTYGLMIAGIGGGLTHTTTVQLTVAPPITITLSVPGPTISGSVIITATVSEQSTATKAVLLLDGTPRGVSTGNPFTWDWVTTLVANGEHSLMVEAYDAEGALIASGEIIVIVDNDVTPKRWMPAGLSEWQVHDVETPLDEPGVAYAVVDARVYKTMDWGVSWGSVGHGLPTDATFHCLSVDPSDLQNVFLGTSSGVYASQDGGETWQPCGLAQAIRDIAVGGTDGQWVYVISWGDTAYRSSDRGNTWVTMLEGVGILHTLSVDPVDGRIAYVGCGDPGAEAVLRKTVDGGENWDATVIASPGEVNSIGQINSTDRQTVYLGVAWGPAGLFKSTDGGASWQRILNCGISTLARAPADRQVVYAEEQWGSYLFLTDDGGEQWENVRDGLPSGTSMRRLAVDCISPAIVYAAAANHGLWSTVYTATNPVPFVAGVWPHAAYNNRATTITITGTNFIPTPDVMLNGTPLLDVTLVSSTTITATVPAGLPAGCYDLTVFNPSGQIGHLPDSFTLLTPTEIEITEPEESAIVSGSVTIRAVTGEGNGIQKVELYLDGALHASTVISPYTWTWASGLMDNGPREIQAKAYDLAGGVTTSPVVHVVVDNLVEETQWTRWAFDGETVEDFETGPSAGMIWSLTANALYRSMDYGVTWNRADAGLSSGVQFVAVGTDSAPGAPIYAARWDEVFVSGDAGETWALDAEFASSLIYLDFIDDTPYAATYGYQVFRRLPTGEWESVGDELDGYVYDVALYRSMLYAGTSEGLYRLAGGVWEPVTVYAYSLSHHTPTTWFEPGLKPRPKLQIETTTPSISVHSIVVLDGTIYLGTSGARGVYKSQDGETWIACDVGLISHSVRKLVASSNGWLFAATTDGVFVSQNQADRWQALDAGLPHSLTGYNVLLDNVTATSLAIIDEQAGQHVLGAVFNSEGVWRLVLVEESMLQPLPPQSPPKAVLIVGPVDPPDHTATLSYIEWSERLANVMEARGMNVVRVYWPDSTWENVRAAISGASIVVYKGHGFGLGDLPEDPTEMAGGCNGFCLVNPEDPMGARLATQDMLVATSQLANDAAAFFFCCYCAGHSSSDPEPVSEALARRRIEAYSSTPLHMGGGGYFSGVNEESLVADLLDHPDKTLGDLYGGVGGEPDHTYTHILWPDLAVWFDGDVEHGWNRAFVGTPDLTGNQVLHPLFGDLDGDCDVDVNDIMEVASRWRCQRGDDCYHERCDLDHDGDIDVVDIMLVVVHWGETCG